MSDSEEPKKKVRKMSNNTSKFNPKNVIFFDLETNGTRPFYKSAIMQISFKSYDEQINENIYVFPYDNIIGATEIHGIDSDVLINKNAISSEVMLNKLLQQFSNTNERYYFVAYNNFGFDQNVLEYHFKIHHLVVPQNWLFLDILPYIQQNYQEIRKNGGYKLSNVYDIMCKKEGELINFHNAEDDVYCLSEIYKKLELEKNKIGPYIRGGYTNNEILKSPISSCMGYAPFFGFERKGVNSISDLMDQYKKMECNIDLFRLYLKQKIGIYSEMYLNKICEQIVVLNELVSI
jgi:DNA polymerase III epsilon subunit-like protein